MKILALQRTAYHEAGHAVAASWLRVPFRYVTIVPDEQDGSLGHIRFTALSKDFGPDIESGSKVRRVLEPRIMVGLAGCAAEAKLVGRYNWVGAHRDWRYAVDDA